MKQNYDTGPWHFIKAHAHYLDSEIKVCFYLYNCLRIGKMYLLCDEINKQCFSSAQFTINKTEKFQIFQIYIYEFN